jgi:tetratricopeptide (TPR) repeat protein
LSKQGILQAALDGVSSLWRQRGADAAAKDLHSGDPERKGRYLFRRGRTSMRTGGTEDAIRAFDQALELVPDYAEAVAARAETLDMLGKTEAAQPEYERARRLWAEQRAGAPDRSYLYRQHGRFTFEVESYELALLRVKTGSFPHLACGNALLAQGRAQDALKCYERALKIKQNDPELTALKGEALSALGRHRQAVEAFDFALAANANAPETLNARAIALAALGRLEEANADWRRQLELLSPRQAPARACVALRLADYRTALPELKRSAAAAPSDGYWSLYELTALSRMGAASDPAVTAVDAVWPGLLLALHAGRIGPEEVLRNATTPGRRAEALFQLGVVAVAKDRDLAQRRWHEVLDTAPAHLIEYAAARNELAHFGS